MSSSELISSTSASNLPSINGKKLGGSNSGYLNQLQVSTHQYSNSNGQAVMKSASSTQNQYSNIEALLKGGNQQESLLKMFEEPTVVARKTHTATFQQTGQSWYLERDSHGKSAGLNRPSTSAFRATQSSFVSRRKKGLSKKFEETQYRDAITFWQQTPDEQLPPKVGGKHKDPVANDVKKMHRQ